MNCGNCDLNDCVIEWAFVSGESVRDQSAVACRGRAVYDCKTGLSIL